MAQKRAHHAGQAETLAEVTLAEVTRALLDEQDVDARWTGIRAGRSRLTTTLEGPAE